MYILWAWGKIDLCAVFIWATGFGWFLNLCHCSCECKWQMLSCYPAADWTEYTVATTKNAIRSVWRWLAVWHIRLFPAPILVHNVQNVFFFFLRARVKYAPVLLRQKRPKRKRLSDTFQVEMLNVYVRISGENAVRCCGHKLHDTRLYGISQLFTVVGRCGWIKWHIARDKLPLY